MHFAAHTECSVMTNNPWRQWQTFLAGLAGANPAGQTRAPRDGASGFAPFLDAAERYAAAARSFMQSAAGGSAPAATAAAGIFSDFLREQFADFQMPWSAAFNAGNGASRAFSFDSPALGATREQQLRMQRMAGAWGRIEDAQRRLQRLWSDALREAATAFAARLASPPPTASAEELRKLYDAWIDCAEDAYARTAQTEAFGNALAEFVNAGSEWRRELQADIEHWAKLLDLPARGEINTLTRRLKSVEDQLRAARTGLKPTANARTTHTAPAAAPTARIPPAAARTARKPPAAARTARIPPAAARKTKRARGKSKS
jgi:hypothetical protein